MTERIIAVILMMTMREVKDDLENIIKEMRYEMNQLKGCLPFTNEMNEKIEMTRSVL